MTRSEAHDSAVQRLEVVRIFDYGLGGVTAPEAPMKHTPGRH